MNQFNWLHLTDLHFGQHQQLERWPNIRAAFFEDLQRLHERSGPWHAVFFTGDLAYSGQSKQFKEMEQAVLVPLWEKLAELGSGDATLFAVPGNHDMQRPKSNKSIPAPLRQLLNHGFDEIADEFWASPKDQYRRVTSSTLKNYVEWWGGTPYRKVKGQDGLLEGDFSATLSIGNLKIGVVGLNTTFLQLAGGDYRGHLCLDIKQLHHACGDIDRWVKQHDVCFLLTHQGKDWLSDSSRKQYPEINPAGRFAVHMFGHMHENSFIGATEGGGRTVRLWQTSSLFGMEKFGEPPQTERRHGYSAGRIEIHDKGMDILCWPRRASYNTNGWKLVADSDRADLQDGDCFKETLTSQPISGSSAVPSSSFLDEDGPIRFSWDDLRELIQNFHSVVTVRPSPSTSKYDYSNIDVQEKNRINNMGQEYFRNIISHHEPYFADIWNFLQSPKNEDVAELYYAIVDELRCKVAAEREEHVKFEAILLRFAETYRRNSSSAIRDGRVLRVLLSFMYVNCDVGLKK